MLGVGVEDADFGPIGAVLFDEELMLGIVLIGVVVGGLGEDHMQGDVEISVVDFALILTGQRPRGEENDAGLN